MRHVAILFHKWFGIIKQLLSLSEGEMTISSPSTGYIALGLCSWAILPASGEQIVMSPSLKGNNCIILYNVHVIFKSQPTKAYDALSIFVII